MLFDVCIYIQLDAILTAKDTKNFIGVIREEQDTTFMKDNPGGQSRGNKKIPLTEREYAELVRSNVSQMLAVANRILNDEFLAEDAVQSAFGIVYEKYETFQGRANITTWIHRITVNQSLMILRQKKQLNESPIDDLLPEFDKSGCRIESQQDEVFDPEIALQKQQSRDVMFSMIEKLPTQYRLVLVLRDIEEMTIDEVAVALEISVANVKIRLHRARSALKQLLEPYFKRGVL